MFDANMILRYLLYDNKEMADKAEEYLSTRNVTVTIEVIAEVIYVLKGVYSIKREEIAEKIKLFLDFVDCQKKSILYLAIDAFGKNNLDFIDCVLYAYHAKEGIEIATFDKKLLKLLITNQ